ncbi:MAG: NAD(P)-dependent oxidoreductase [Bacteroidetes bacterium]|nr:NAD(P)-dependent oxidoreductase [Bacteroidota bacterium]
MKIFVIGGTGLVGSYLLPRLVKKGHEVFALTRSDNKIEKIKEIGAVSISGDIRKPQEFKNNLPEQLDFIVLLAMPGVVPGHRMTRKRKEELRIETNDFFRNSMELAIQYHIPIILPSGTSFKTKNEEIADETWPILRVGLTEIGKDTDEMVNIAINTGHPEVIQLIYGKIYGNGGLFRFMYEMMEKGRSKIIGKGDNYIPNIHAGDVANAIIKAIEKKPVGEKFIIADDMPVTQKDFTIYMAELMNRKRPGHIPTFIIKLVLGSDFYEIIRMNCKVSNEKAKRMLDWKPEYPSYKEGLTAVIEDMKEHKPYFA